MSFPWNQRPTAGRSGIVRRIALGSVALASAGLLAAGCSSTSKSSVAAPVTDAPTTLAPTTTTPLPVTATETEYKIELSKTTFTAGTYTFNVVNAGTFKHTLVFNGPGVADQSSGTVLAGQSGSMTVTLAPGTYDVYCSVPTHKGKGMDTSITVS